MIKGKSLPCIWSAVEVDKEPAEDPFLEMCLMCIGLPAETSGRLPDTFASVHYMLPPPDERWVIHARTEIVEVTASLWLLQDGRNCPLD